MCREGVQVQIVRAAWERSRSVCVGSVGISASAESGVRCGGRCGNRCCRRCTGRCRERCWGRYSRGKCRKGIAGAVAIDDADTGRAQDSVHIVRHWLAL